MDAPTSQNGIAWLLPRARDELGVTGTPRELPDLTRQPTIVDPRTGVSWRRRGGQPVPEKRLQRLFGDPTVRVLHDYLGSVHEVPPAQRAQFWSKAQASMAASEHSAFYAAEFKSGQQAHLLVIHEEC